MISVHNRTGKIHIRDYKYKNDKKGQYNYMDDVYAPTTYASSLCPTIWIRCHEHLHGRGDHDAPQSLEDIRVLQKEDST
jgi:hypothetical protein